MPFVFHKWVKRPGQKEPSGTYRWDCARCGSHIWHASRPAANRRVGIKYPADIMVGFCGDVIVHKIMGS